MGGGLSVSDEESSRIIYNKLEASSLEEAMTNPPEPVLITGRVDIGARDAAIAPLSGKRCAYHRSRCYHIMNDTRKVNKINDESYVDFELVDLHNPNIRVRVPFRNIHSQFDLTVQTRDMQFAKNPKDLESEQLLLMRKHNFDPESYAVMGMSMKKLEFTEETILLNQCITMVCMIKDEWVVPIHDINFAKSNNWSQQECKAWRCLFKHPGILIYENYKQRQIPTISTVAHTVHALLPSQASMNPQQCIVPTIGVTYQNLNSHSQPGMYQLHEQHPDCHQYQVQHCHSQPVWPQQAHPYQCQVQPLNHQQLHEHQLLTQIHNKPVDVPQVLPQHHSYTPVTTHNH